MSVVAITGVSGYLGQTLLSQLDLDDEVEAIVGVDRQPLAAPPPDKLTFVQHDLTQPLGELFANHGVTHAIHLATVGAREHEADPSLDLTIVGNVLDACGAAGAKSVCVASSVIVYGAHSDNTILLEGSIPRPNSELPAAATKFALEQRCYDFAKAYPETALQIVRPCPILGPTASGLFTRLLDAPRIYGPWRVDPRFQFVHEDDATRAIHRLVKSESFGVFNLAGDGSLTLSQIAQLAERRLVRLPAFLLRFASWLAWRLGKTDLHPGLLPFLFHPWLVAAVKVRNSAYFVPRYDSADALLSYLEHRDQRDPAALEPFEWEAPTPSAKPAPAGDFGQRPGFDAEDRAKTKPLGRPPEGLSPANDTPDPDAPDPSAADLSAPVVRALDAPSSEDASGTTETPDPSEASTPETEPGPPAPDTSSDDSGTENREASAAEAPEGGAEELTEPSVAEAPEGRAEEPTEPSAAGAPEGRAEEPTEPSAAEAPEGRAADAPEGSADEAPEPSTPDAPEGSAADAPGDSAADALGDSAADALGDSADEAPEPSAPDAPEGSAADAPGGSADEAPEPNAPEPSEAAAAHAPDSAPADSEPQAGADASEVSTPSEEGSPPPGEGATLETPEPAREESA